MPAFRRRRRRRIPRYRKLFGRARTIAFMRYKARKGRRQPRRRITIRSAGLNVQPDIQWVKLKYSEYRPLSSTAGVGVVGYRYRGNGVYDPDQTGIGRVPTGFAPLALLYSRYYCAGSKIEIEYVNNTAQITNMYIFPSITQITASDVGGTYVPDENRYCKTKMIGANTGGANRWKSSMYMNNAKQYGQVDCANDINFQSDTGTTPSRQWYWHVFAQDANNEFDVTRVEGRVTITYYLKFFNRRPQQSTIL